jgi:hypothetical protein
MAEGFGIHWKLWRVIKNLNSIFDGGTTDQALIKTSGDDFDFDWADVPSGGGSAGQVATDINTATPPTTEAVTGNYTIVDLAEDDTLATLGYTASNTLVLKNLMHSGDVAIDGEISTGGTTHRGALFEPGSSTSTMSLYADNNKKVVTAGDGVQIWGISSTQGPRIEGYTDDGVTEKWVLDSQGSFGLDITNKGVNGFTILKGTNASSSVVTELATDPNQGVKLYHQDTEVAKSVAKADGGLQVDQGGGYTAVQLQGTGQPLGTTTTAALNDSSNAVNTSAAKVQGYVLYNTDTDNPVYATGNADNSVWVDGAGTTVHSPS